MAGDNVRGSRGVLGEGVDGSGPVAIFAEGMECTAVLSSFRNFMAASQSIHDSPPHPSGDAVLSYGVFGSVTAIPAGYAIETIVTVRVSFIKFVSLNSRILLRSSSRSSAR